MVRETVRIEGLQGVLRTLQQLPPEIVSKNGGPVRFALRKAAQVIQKEAISNLERVIAEPNADGEESSTGLLKKNIVLTRGRRNSFKGESFLVRIRSKRYPESTGKKSVTTAQVGRLLEYGTETRAPMPWLRPAYAAKRGEALQVFSVEINKRLNSIQRRLERANRVKT